MKTHAQKYTIAEASRELGISTNAVRKAIKKGRLVATKGKYVVERTIRRTLTGYLHHQEGAEQVSSLGAAFGRRKKN